MLCPSLAGSVASAATQPPAAVKSLTAWYDLGDSSTLTLVPLGVTQWNDKSGNNQNLTITTTSAAMPMSTAGDIKSGVSDMTFTGTAAFFHTTLSAAPGNLPPHTMFVVGKGQAGVAGVLAAYSGTSTTSSNSVIGISTGTTKAWWFGGPTSAGLSGGVNDGNAHLFTKVYDGSNNNGYYDGSAAVSTTLSYNLTDNHIDVGARDEAGDLPLSGVIGEVIIYNTALSTANYQYIEGYLACKWGLQANLPAGHPYKSSCPSGDPLTSGFSGPIAWYDASDTSSLVNQSTVSTVRDKSGQNNTLGQSTSASQPSVTTISGHQGLMFSGGQDLLSSTTNTLATGSNPSTFFAVAAFTGTLTGGYAQFLSYGNGTNYQMRGVGKSSGNAFMQSQEYFADVNATASWSSSPALIFASFGTSTEAVAGNGGTATSASHTPNTSAGTAVHVGTKVGTNAWTGPVYEMLVYNATLSTAERQFVEGYLACKYGLQANLPGTHPYASTCPATATANLSLVLGVSPGGLQSPGTDLTYTSTFTNSSGTLVYSPTISCPVPINTWFKIGTATQALGSTGLTAGVSYSSDGGATFTYTPASGAGGAASGYDANVTTIRWALSGAIGPAAAVNSGTVSYQVRIQ